MGAKTGFWRIEFPGGRRFLKERRYSDIPLRRIVWLKLWSRLINWHEQDRFAIIAERLGCSKQEIAFAFSDPRWLDIREMADLAFAMDAQWEIKVTSARKDQP